MPEAADETIELDMAGTCCQDWAQMGAGSGLGGKSGKVFMAWRREQRKRRTGLVLQEITQLFPISLLRSEFKEEDFGLLTGIIDPATMGEPCSRPRRVSLLFDRRSTL